MATDLLFELGGDAVPGGAVPLLFGEEPGVVFVDIELAAVVRPVGAWSVEVVPVQSGGARAGLAWERTAAARGGPVAAPWGDFAGAAIAGGAGLPWGDFDGQRLGRPDALAWGRTAANRPAPARLPWGVAQARQRPAVLPWQRPGAAVRPGRLPWDRALAGGRSLHGTWGTAARAGRDAVLPWDRAVGVGGQNLPLPGDPVVVGFTPGPAGPVHLHFCVEAGDDSNDLVLGRENCLSQPRIPAGLAIGARRTYMQTYNITALRLPDLAVVPLTGFSLSTDTDAFGWTLQASGPISLLTQLAPVAGVPAGLRLTIDGMTWEFVVEGLRRNRSWGDLSASITARSAGVLLAEPYAPSTSYLNAVPITAAQIVLEALSGTGVTLDMQLDDWTVPAGIWTFRGPPLAVARRVAEAAGGLVRCPRVGDEIILAPRRLVMPWERAAAVADVTVALDAVVVEGYERADRPAYDGIYVSGQAQGVLALVKRTGSAPSLLLPIETDPLLTDLVVCEQRGRARLGDAGPQARMTLSLPVLTGLGEPGVIDVGQLIEVTDPDGDWKGLVTAVSVAWRAPVLEQTITLERHL